MNLLFIGDIVGQPGRQYLTEHLRKIKENYKIDVCIANGENSAHGNSITVNCARELWDAGVDIITTGNHIFKRDVVQVFDDFPYLGIWTAQKGVVTNYICIEPWSTLPDGHFMGRRLTDKPGIVVLEPGESKTLTFRSAFE